MLRAGVCVYACLFTWAGLTYESSHHPITFNNCCLFQATKVGASVDPSSSLQSHFSVCVCVSGSHTHTHTQLQRGSFIPETWCLTSATILNFHTLPTAISWEAQRSAPPGGGLFPCNITGVQRWSSSAIRPGSYARTCRGGEPAPRTRRVKPAVQPAGSGKQSLWKGSWVWSDPLKSSLPKPFRF